MSIPDIKYIRELTMASAYNERQCNRLRNKINKKIRKAARKGLPFVTISLFRESSIRIFEHVLEWELKSKGYSVSRRFDYYIIRWNPYYEY